MTDNGVRTSEDAEMSECDGDNVVTMMDVLKEQEDFEEDANAVLGASDDKNCTYSKGYVKRQAIYACLTCCPDAATDPMKRAGVCLACSLACHENHELAELYTKRNFRCDCGNPKFSQPCQFTPNKSDLNYENKYNQNFSGVYCVCHRPYPDPEATEEEEMLQCIVCEDWLHINHLEATVPNNDHYSEMVCKDCMEDNDFLHDYSHLIVNVSDKEIIVTDPDLDVSTILKIKAMKEAQKKEKVTNGDTDMIKDKVLETEKDIEPETPKEKEIETTKDKELETPKDKELETPKDKELETPKDKELETPNAKGLETSNDKELETTNEKELDTLNEKENETLKDNTIETPKDNDIETPKEKEIEAAEIPEGINKDETTTDVDMAEAKPNDSTKKADNSEEKEVEDVNPSPGIISDADVTSTDENNPDTEVETQDNKKDDEKTKEANQTEAMITEKNVEHEESSENTTTSEILKAIDNVTNPEETIAGSATDPKEHEKTDASEESTEKQDNELNGTTSNNSEKEIDSPTTKRKLSTEEEDTSSKKAKLDVEPCIRPRGVKRVYKGATFWPANLRQQLCTCNECLSMYRDLAVLFLTDPDDTVTAYEALGKENNGGTLSSQYEKGMQALSSLDRVQQINALTEYNKMRDKLLDFLKSFKERKEIVKEEDIKAFFAGMKPKREPDGVYFCR